MATTYTIQPNDTLSGIAARFGLNYNDLARWNNIPDVNRIYAGRTLNLYNPVQQPIATQPQASTPTYTPPTPTNRTPFSQVLPYEKVFDANLINELALSQLRPEVERAQGQEMDLLRRNQAQTGAYRSGRAGADIQRLRDAYSRQLKEQTAQFTGNVNDWLTNWYNTQYERYYRNPSAYVAPTLPTFDQFMGSNPTLASAYTNFLNK